MRRNGTSFFPRNDGGSTLLEVMVALAIISILGVGAWTVVGTAIRISGRINERALENARVLQLDDSLRDFCGRVRPPFWTPGQAVEETEDGLKTAYLDGEAEKAFTLGFRDGALLLEDGAASMRFTDFTDAKASPASNDSGVYGITLDLTAKSGSRYSITARFGGLPIANGDAP